MVSAQPFAGDEVAGVQFDLVPHGHRGHVEAKEAVEPLAELGEHTTDLVTDDILHALGSDGPHLDEDAPQPPLLAGPVLPLESLGEHSLGDEPAAHQDGAERFANGAAPSVDDSPAPEDDHAVCLATGEGELPRLLIDGQELQDRGKGKLPELAREAALRPARRGRPL